MRWEGIALVTLYKKSDGSESLSSLFLKDWQEQITFVALYKNREKNDALFKKEQKSDSLFLSKK